jgi:hypothetical protein
MLGNPEIIAGTAIETFPFQNPSLNGKRKRLIFQHRYRAISLLHKDLVLEGEDNWCHRAVSNSPVCALKALSSKFREAKGLAQRDSRPRLSPAQSPKVSSPFSSLSSSFLPLKSKLLTSMPFSKCSNLKYSSRS